MELRNKIWFDLVHSKYGDEYLIHYIKRQKKIRKGFKVITILFSASGIFGWTIWEALPVISCIGIALVQLVTSIETYVIHTEKQIEDLGELRIKYYERTNQLEKLWFDLDNNYIDDKDAKNRFFKLRDSTKEIEVLDNKLDVKEFKKIKVLADTKVRDYLKQYFNYE